MKRLFVNISFDYEIMYYITKKYCRVYNFDMQCIHHIIIIFKQFVEKLIESNELINR